MLKSIIIRCVDFVFSPLYGKKHVQSFFGFLHSISIKGMNMRHSSPSTNGESRLIGCISSYYKRQQLEPVIFDIGANQGSYSAELIQAFGGKLKLYCFEPSASTFRLLKDNLSKIDSKSISLNNFGLSDKAASIQLYVNRSNHSISSIYPRDNTFAERYDTIEEIQVMRADDYCVDKSIAHVHFIKIDVEGNEIKVLKGAEKLIKSNQIDFIQFEFSPRNIDARTYLKDFYTLLGNNFLIYRIMKNGIHLLDPYSYDYEIFVESNYLAVNKKLKIIF